MTAPAILYSFRRCPYAMRARLALAVAGVSVELREVALRAKPAAMLTASPKGTVPVLIPPNGAVIDQSLDIMRWALTQHDPEAWLNGDDPALIASCDDHFKFHLDRTKYPERHASDPTVHRAAGLEWLGHLEDRLNRHDNLCRPARGLADAAIFPFVRQFAAIDPAGFAAEGLPQVQAWLERHIQSPLFAVIMARHAPWAPDSAPVFWPA